MESLNWASFRVKSTSFDAGLRLIREPLESPKIDLETDESEATDSESKLPEFDSFDSGLVRKIREIRLQISAVVTVLQKFPVNVLFTWLTQIFVAVSTVDLLEVFRFSEVLQKFPNKSH